MATVNVRMETFPALLASEPGQDDCKKLSHMRLFYRIDQGEDNGTGLLVCFHADLVKKREFGEPS